jgi:hypothetical protein
MSASAAITCVTASPDCVIMNPPADTVGYTANFFQDRDPAPARGWAEQQNYTLFQDVVVDIINAGAYDQLSDLGTFTIAKGTTINSYYMYFDPRVDSVVATFHFSEPIVGIIVESDRIVSTGPIVRDDRLLKTDFLAVGSNLPGAHFNNRGFEWATDSLIVNVGLNEITVRMTASSPGDQMRILTAGDEQAQVPEPGTYALMGAGLLGLAALRRKN